MGLPACKDFVQPVLRVLSAGALPAAEFYPAVASEMALEPADKALTIADGTPCYKVRAKQARYWLSKKQLVERQASQAWRVTGEGRRYLESGTVPRSLNLRQVVETSTGATPKQARSSADVAPEERLLAAHAEIREQVQESLLARIQTLEWQRFEVLVLDVLEAMHYLTPGARTELTQQGADGGVDGVLYLDKLGLDPVYVQAKRWKEKKVGRPTIQAFVGAMDGRRSMKGVVFTAGDFSKAAIAYAQTCTKQVRLIDGTELSSLMMELRVGIAADQTLVVPRVDVGYFEDE